MVDWTPIEPGDVPTYLGFMAAATAAWFAAKTWFKQKVLVTEQLRVINEDRTRREEADLREQASKISAWFEFRNYSNLEPDPEYGHTGDAGSFIVIQNSSDGLVYGTVVTMVFVMGAAHHTGEEVPGNAFEWRRHIGPLPPGRFSVELPSGWGATGIRPGAEIAFTDPNGRHWVRRATGLLENIPISAPQHYRMDYPLDFTLPDREAS